MCVVETSPLVVAGRATKARMQQGAKARGMLRLAVWLAAVRRSHGGNAPPPGSHDLALLYHGAYHRGTEVDHGARWTGGGLCSDFFYAAHNHYVSLVEPLRQMGMRLHTVFHTFRSGCPSRDQALVDFLNPIVHQFDDPGATPRIADSYIIALDLALASGVDLDYLIFCRFEVIYKVPLQLVNLDWAKLNVAWRDQEWMWEHEKIACDLFYLLPKSLAGTLRAALDESGDFDTWWSGTGHFMYNFLPPEVQEHQVHFTIDEGWLYHTAGQDGPNVCNDEALGWRPPNMRTTYEPEAWMFINRECSASLCDVHLVGCVDGRLVGGEAVPLPLTNGFHVDAPLAVPPSSSSPSPPLPQSPPYPPELYCPSSCVDALQHGATGSGPTQLCLRGGGAPITLWCDMETAGGGWAYVARGSDPTSGRQTNAYGLVQSDPGLNERWSLGEAAINALNEHGQLEFFVTIGPGNGPGYVPYEWFRIFRTGSRLHFSQAQDGFYGGMHVWDGAAWRATNYLCDADDAGPCWEPGETNICCRLDPITHEFEGCARAEEEGQWSNKNRNQHLRCFLADMDTSHLVLFVRSPAAPPPWPPQSPTPLPPAPPELPPVPPLPVAPPPVLPLPALPPPAPPQPLSPPLLPPAHAVEGGLSVEGIIAIVTTSTSFGSVAGFFCVLFLLQRCYVWKLHRQKFRRMSDETRDPDAGTRASKTVEDSPSSRHGTGASSDDRTGPGTDKPAEGGTELSDQLSTTATPHHISLDMDE